MLDFVVGDLLFLLRGISHALLMMPDSASAILQKDKQISGEWY